MAQPPQALGSQLRQVQSCNPDYLRAQKAGESVLREVLPKGGVLVLKIIINHEQILHEVRPTI